MPAKANIYLTGFSGAGKSVSGRLASNKLGWAFVDTDDLIEQRAGKQIPQVFADDGEERFRDIERGVLLDISGGSRQVIATGGGVPVDPSNRKLMQETGIIVRLTASPEMIHQRLAYGKKRTRALRPLLGDDAPVERIRRLLSQRESSYSQADFTIDTDIRAHADVALDIANAWHTYQGAQGID
jgi:shikimate kinase